MPTECRDHRRCQRKNQHRENGQGYEMTGGTINGPELADYAEGCCGADGLKDAN
jgi:hypothetical protein